VQEKPDALAFTRILVRDCGAATETIKSFFYSVLKFLNLYMSIVVNPHTQQEEQALLAFLDNMKYDYTREAETFVLSEAQEREILERDRQYEAGETETYSLDEIIAHFNLNKK
jgi:hypothetical protein